MKEFIDKTTENLVEKIKVTSLEIIVNGTKEKPYFEIKYKELGKEDYDIGYSSYDLNYVFDWKNECFEIVTELAEEYNKKQEHEVWLNGCDDDTIFTMEMTNNEYEFLKRVSELANETSTYHCMPRLFLDEGVEYAPPYTEGE